MKSEKPNIVVIMTDQMRGDCLSGVGHPDVQTPYLDTLMKNGICFTNAYSACPSCVPARTGLFTGMNPRHHGRVGYEDRVPFDYPYTLAGQLSKAGYYTQAIGKMHIHPQRKLAGFHNVILHDGNLTANRNVTLPYYEEQDICDDYLYALKKSMGIDIDLYDLGIDSNSWVTRPWMYEEKYHPTNWVTHEAIDFFRRRDTELPFFLFLSYVRPHPPFDAPQCFFDMYQEERLHSPIYGEWEDRRGLEEKGRIIDSDTGPLDERMLRRAQRGYYACISHIDNQIGRFLLALDRYGLKKNTLIFFLSDHGELLGDHYMYRKVRPYQGSIRIPLLISGPEDLCPGRGICEDLAEICDIMPTILEKAGAEIPPTVDGEDLLKQDRIKRSYIHGGHAAENFGSYLGNQYIVTKIDKYIWYMEDGREQYFCLADDPEERVDRIREPQYQDRIQYLRRLLINKLEDGEEGYVKNGKLKQGQKQKNLLKNRVK